MFRNQIDPIESGSPQYSDSFDRLLSWGIEVLLSDGRTPSTHDEPAALQDLEKENLLLGLGRFEKDVQKAVNYLHGTATFAPDPEAPELIPAALDVMDNCILLSLFLSQKGPGLNIPAPMIDRLTTMSLQLHIELTPPCHRLIPLNSWRQNKYNNLPESIRYHLPWYDDWKTAPEHIPEQLTLHWQAIVDEEDPSWLDIPLDLAKAYLKEIKKDTPYLQFLAKKADQVRQEMETMAGSIPLGLAALGNAIPMDTHLPDAVTDKGFQAVACAVLTEPFHSWKDKFEQLLLAGWFGPDLDDAQRMDLFKKIAIWLKSDVRTSPDSLTYQLNRWKNDPLQAGQLLDHAMQLWLELLNNSAQKIPKAVAYRSGAFEDAVKTLLASEPISLLDEVKELVDKLRARIPTLDILAPGEIIDAICRTGSPTRHALGYATDTEADCLLITVSSQEKKFQEIHRPRVEQLKREQEGNRLILSGEIDGIGEKAIVELSCRYSVDEKLYQPTFCGITEKGFLAVIDNCMESNGHVYLVMIEETEQ